MRIPLLTLACGLTLTACGGGDEAARSDTTATRADTTGQSVNAETSANIAGAVTAIMRDASGREIGALTLTEAPRGAGGNQMEGGTAPQDTTSGVMQGAPGATPQGITVTGQLTGLPPGERAIHIHAVGQCEAPGFTSAGPHWNPADRQHGTENPQGPHHGDMPNITVGADSTVSVQVTTTAGTLRQTDALLDADGAAVVIHAGADDYRTDPSGNAGDRIACGVVGAGMTDR